MRTAVLLTSKSRIDQPIRCDPDCIKSQIGAGTYLEARERVQCRSFSQ